MQLPAPRRERLLAVDEQRIERARLIAKIVLLGEVVLADDAQKDRPRELILGLHARNGVAPDERVIGAPPVVLIDVRARDAQLIGRPQIQRERQIVDVGLRPLEEVLVLPADVRRRCAEARPLRRRQRRDVVAVRNSPDADERNRVDLRADRSLDRVVRVQRLVPAERFPVHGGEQSPAAAHARRRGDVKLLVLRVTAPHEVRVFPDVVVQHVAGDGLEETPALVEPRAAVIDRAVRDGAARDESRRRAEVVVDAVQ